MLNLEIEIKNALKAKNQLALKVYRNIKAEKLVTTTSKGFTTYTDETEISMLKRMVKSLKNSENEYFQAGRQDLVADCVAEREFIENLLPSPPDPEKIKSALNSMEILREGTLTKKEMGNAIKWLKSLFPSADGKMISEIVKSYIV